MINLAELSTVVLISISLISSGYILFSTLRVRSFGKRLRSDIPTTSSFAVTILKPLCGLDPDLLENLRSFCRQQHTTFQIIFGVMDKDDPAIIIVHQIMQEFPDLDLKLVVNDHVHGTNYKISNLINMYALAKYDLIVISDSDMRVRQDYLNIVTAPFQDATVGAVTCLYRGRAINGLWSKLAAMFINEWFLPSVLVANTFATNSFCFGATMAVRRDLLEKTGGLGGLVDYLADDYMLGKRVQEAGFSVHLAPLIVENVLQESTFQSLFQHELRWARTMRTVQPVGYTFSFLTDALPFSLIAATFLYFSSGSNSIVVSGNCLRPKTKSATRFTSSPCIKG